MKNIVLTAYPREQLGKKSKTLREKGLLPAVIYNSRTESIPLVLEAKEFLQVYKQSGETDIIDLVIERDGKKEVKKVLIQDVDYHFLTGLPIHVDFYEVEMNKPVTARVSLVFIGESPAVKKGGILVKAMDEIEVEALPGDLPHLLEVDISPLAEFEQTIYVKDLKVPSGVKILVKPDTPIATVSAPLTEEELAKELERVATPEEVQVAEEKEKEKEKVEEKPEEKLNVQEKK